jgi:hypothetical protein
MKLINNTKVPDETLERVLIDAAHSLKRRINVSKVVVYVGLTRRYRSRGVAFNATRVKWDKKWRSTNGAFQIWLNTDKSRALVLAECFFHTAQHEWGHISDYQCNKFLEWSEQKNGRRPLHDYRPEEKRANEYVEKAKPKDLYADSILNLAIEIETYKKEKENEIRRF